MINFKHKGATLYISPIGHIKAFDCGSLKSFVTKQSADTNSIQAVYLEMKDCTYMDSTFIGVVAGINKQLRKNHKNSIQIQNITKVCKDLFDSMSLSPLLVFLEKPVSFPQDMETKPDSVFISKKDIAEAHEELIELSDENEKKFGVLTKILREG